jgi:hypothetical protein
MDAREALGRESLASFLQDVPPGAHAACIVHLPEEALLSACLDEARDAGEQLVLLGFAGAERDTWDLEAFDAEAPRRLDELARRADHAGRQGVLAVVDARQSMREAGVQAHLDGERAVGRRTVRSARVLCVYRRDDLAPDVRAVMESTHSVLLRPGAGVPGGA